MLFEFIHLSIENLSADYGSHALFHDLTFQLHSGHALHITGRNGVGKTTLLRMIAGLKAPSGGYIHKPQQTKLIYLGPRPSVQLELNVIENIKFFQTLQLNSGENDAEAILQKLNLHDYRLTPAKQLSSGLQRRLSLARLLITETPIWLLDEPFSMLDSRNVCWLENLLQDHLHNNGMIIFTSHQKINFPHTTLALEDYADCPV